jgi:hypothetical protein
VQAHGWVADAESSGVLARLEERRIGWRAQREAGPDAGGVAADTLMPIEPGLEDRWKYWVPQPMPDDAVTSAPASVRELKLLDPACGSGHFLVIAFELLFALYQEEARHRGQASTPREIVESILEHNLHGIDIDPKAVQIAAAALMLKARQLCADAEPRVMNLVAPALSLAALADGDPALRELHAAVQAETGIPPELTARIVSGLAGADHLGTLLRVDRAIDEAIETYGDQLSKAVPTKVDQGGLFTGFAPRRRKRITAAHAKAAVLDRLEGFLDHHTGAADLGLRLRGEQLAAGVRFVRLVREGQYDIVIGNPPYQGTSKMADKAYVEREYPRGKADLYAAFLERGLQLAKSGGVSALLTMRNWMFIKQFSVLREWLLATYDLRMLGDVDRGAFDEIAPAQVVVTVCMSLFRRSPPVGSAAIALKAFDAAVVTQPDETKRKRAALLCQVGRWEFSAWKVTAIGETPIVYWWKSDRYDAYRNAKKLGDVAPVRQGMATTDNERFVRKVWEVRPGTLFMQAYGRGQTDSRPHNRPYRWVPYVKGAAGACWLEASDCAVLWANGGLEVKACNDLHYGSFSRNIKNEDYYFRRGIAFSMIGSEFRARAHALSSIIGHMGSSVFRTMSPQRSA